MVLVVARLTPHPHTHTHTETFLYNFICSSQRFMVGKLTFILLNFIILGIKMNCRKKSEVEAKIFI